MASPLFQKLSIRTREVFDGDAARAEDRTVFCPHHEETRDVEGCKVCSFARSVDKDVVVCRRGSANAEAPFAIGNDPRVDIAAAASRTAIHTITPRDVICVRANASLEMVATLLVERNLRCLPVVDAEDRLIGIVSKSDVLRDHADAGEWPVRVELEPGFHLEPLSHRTVAEIMTPCVHALPEDSPIAFAIALLAFESLHEVPIVSSDGQVVGVATALDVLGWLATRMGYEVPRAQSSEKQAGSTK